MAISDAEKDELKGLFIPWVKEAVKELDAELEEEAAKNKLPTPEPDSTPKETSLIQRFLGKLA